MRWLAYCSAGLCLLGAAVPAMAAQERPFPVVSVTGEGSVTATPDIAHVSAGIISEGKMSREAADANARLMTAVIAAARQAGIPDKDIGTSRYSIYPNYHTASSGRDGAPRIAGYRAQNTVRVTIRDLAKVGDVIDALTAAGANNIAGVAFEISNADKLLDQARGAAYADAKRKAELYARAANAQLGRTVSVQENAADMPRPMMARAAPKSASDGAPPTPIMPGEEKIRIQIGVSFELAQ